MPFVTNEALDIIKNQIVSQIRNEIGSSIVKTIKREIDDVLKDRQMEQLTQIMEHQIQQVKNNPPQTVTDIYGQLGQAMGSLGNTGMFLSKRGLIFVRDRASIDAVVLALAEMREEMSKPTPIAPTIPLDKDVQKRIMAQFGFEPKSDNDSLDSYPDGKLEKEDNKKRGRKKKF